MPTRDGTPSSLRALELDLGARDPQIFAMDAAALQQIGALPPGALVLLDRTDVAGWNWLGWRGFECDRYSFGSQPHVMRRALVQPQPSPEPAPPKFAVTILA